MPRRAFISLTGIKPSRIHAPLAAGVAHASISVSGLSSPVMASSKSRGVIMPCTTPYSSTTSSSRPDLARNCSSISSPLRVSGTNAAFSQCFASAPSAFGPNSSRRATLMMPITSSSPPSHTGYHECDCFSPRVATYCSACATVFAPSSQSISLRGTISDVKGRSSR